MLLPEKKKRRPSLTLLYFMYSERRPSMAKYDPKNNSGSSKYSSNLLKTLLCAMAYPNNGKITVSLWVRKIDELELDN